MTPPAAQVRVLVADDDPDIRALTAIAVRKAGLDLVHAAEDGDTAWQAIQDFVPDIALLDVSMPGLTGLDLCRMIRDDARLAGMSVILLSAAVAESSQLAGADAGANQYLTKPFSPRELAAQLSSMAELVRQGA